MPWGTRNQLQCTAERPYSSGPTWPGAAEGALQADGGRDAEPERAVDADRVVDPQAAQQRVGVVVGHVEVGEVGPHLQRVDARVAQRACGVRRARARQGPAT